MQVRDHTHIRGYHHDRRPTYKLRYSACVSASLTHHQNNPLQEASQNQEKVSMETYQPSQVPHPLYYSKGEKTPRLTQPATRPGAHNNSLAKKQQLANTTIVYQCLINVDVPTDLSQNYPKRDLAKHPQPHPHIRLRQMCYKGFIYNLTMAVVVGRNMSL